MVTIVDGCGCCLICKCQHESVCTNQTGCPPASGSTNGPIHSAIDCVARCECGETIRPLIDWCADESTPYRAVAAEEVVTVCVSTCNFFDFHCRSSLSTATSSPVGVSVLCLAGHIQPIIRACVFAFAESICVPDTNQSGGELRANATEPASKAPASASEANVTKS